MFIEYEVALVFGIYTFIFLSATGLALFTYGKEKNYYNYLKNPISYTIINKTFDAKELKATAQISVFDSDSQTSRRVKKHLAHKLLEDIEPLIKFTKTPPIDQPYEIIEASIFIGVERGPTN